MLRFFRRKTKIDYKEWDMDTVTATDYAVECKITSDMYHKFKQEFEVRLTMPRYENHKDEEYSLMYEFKQALRRSLEHQLTALPAVGKELNKIEVAEINFSFNNTEVIKLLAERGDALKYGKVVRAREIEEKLGNMKAELYEEHSVPLSAFVIFEEEEGAHRALESERGSVNFYDEPLKFKRPSEPSDIIWENRHTPIMKWIYRALIVSLILLLLLAATFALIYFLKTWVTKEQYGNTNCSEIYKIYPNHNALKKYAIKEWYALYEEKIDTTLDGALGCFCEKEKASHGYSTIIKQDYSHPSVLDNKGEIIKDNICFDYLISVYWSALLNQGIGIIIVFINYFCRYILIILVQWIGYATQTNLNKAITNAIFVTEFFNTGIILLLIKSNLTESGVPLMDKFFNGLYYDFDSHWYDDIGGAIAFTVFYSAIWPIIEFAFFYGLRVFYRVLDSKSLCPSKYKTAKTTIQQYVDLYGGSEYLIYWKYSRIINLSWVTFMFGPGLPILYPTFLLAMVIQYIVERLCMAYYYKQPPMYDDKLNNNTINWCYYAFGLQMFFGYWMFSNRQIFSNKVVPIETGNSPMRSGHSIWDPIEMDHAFPFLITGCLFTLGYIAYLIYLVIDRYRMRKYLTVENLKPFPGALKEFDREWLTSEERYVREHGNYRLLYDKFYKRLVASSTLQIPNALNNKTFIQNVPTYDILANPYYEERFQYFPVMSRGDLDKRIFMSNKVRKLLNLPYLNPFQIKKFNFSNKFFRVLADKVNIILLKLNFI